MVVKTMYSTRSAIITKKEIVEKVLLTSKPVFPFYQGESTIFDKGNFLYNTPDTNNLIK